MNSPCRCGHTEHSWEEPTVCKDVNCKCIKYEPATDKYPTYTEIERYKDQFDQVSDRVKFLLKNIKYLRNLKNLGFVVAYWELMCGLKFTEEQKKKMIDPEVIRRIKQKMVEKDPELYGNFSPTFEEQKEIKQYAITEWIVESNGRWR